MKTISKTILCIFIAMLFINCDNDNGNAPNQNQCVNGGITYLDTMNSIQTQINENDLKTQYFPNGNGPGMPTVEVGFITSPSNTWFITDVLTLNGTGIGDIRFQRTDYNNVIVTCQRTGSAVGDELRFDVVLGSDEFEICITIDEVLP